MKRGEGGLITPFFLAYRYERGEGRVYLRIFICIYIAINQECCRNAGYRASHMPKYLDIYSGIAGYLQSELNNPPSPKIFPSGIVTVATLHSLPFRPVASRVSQ